MLTEYYFNNLSAPEQSAYNIIRIALTNSESGCTVTGISSGESAKDIWRSVVFDHPEIINYPGLFCQPLGTTSGEFRFTFQYSEIDRYAYEEKLNRLINKINNKMSASASDYVACKIIFDELASFIEYEDNVLEEYLRLEQENSSETINFMREHSTSFSPYGVLMNSKGVCQGIAKLFKIICDRFGVQCACVEAKTLNCSADSANNHMLNVVEINGERAFVDITNCLKIKNLPIIKYDFFLMTQRIINKTFTIAGEFQCTNETLNYFVKNKLRFTSINDLRAYLSSYTYKSTNGEVRCHYDGSKLDDKELEDLFFYIINSHCREGHFMPYASVKNGFCTGLIKSDSEA